MEMLVFNSILWKDSIRPKRKGGTQMLALGTGGIVALAIVVVVLVALFVYVLGKARRSG